MTIFQDALDRVRHETNDDDPPKKTKRLSLEEITTEPDLFQMREAAGSLVETEAHISTLLEIITQSSGAVSDEAMDPMKIWWTGARWVLLDGHHRHEAYTRYVKLHEKAKSALKVAVEVTEAATVEDAVKVANAENRKARLNTTQVDKLGYAWRLVTSDLGWSIRTIEQSSGASKSTVNRMRRTMKSLTEKGYPSERLAGLDWDTVQDLKKRRDMDTSGGAVLDYDADDALLAQGAEWARRLGKEFGSKLHQAPDIAAAMLLSYGRETTSRILQSRFLYPLREELEAEDRASIEDETDGLDGDDALPSDF